MKIFKYQATTRIASKIKEKSSFTRSAHIILRSGTTSARLITSQALIATRIRRRRCLITTIVAFLLENI